MKIKKIIIQEFNDWKWFEILLLASTMITILALSIIKKSSLIAIFGGVTGITGAVFGSKGKISAYMFTIPSQILYAIIAFNQPGDQMLFSALLLSCIYIPTNLIGIFKWINKRDKQSNVLPRRISFVGIIFVVICLTMTYVSYSLILEYSSIKINKLWLDGAIMWMTIFALVLYVLRFIEQWAIWFIKNIIIILMWVVILIGGKQNATAIIMIPTYIAYLLNACYGFINWHKLHKKTQIYQLPLISNATYSKLSLWKKITYKFNKMFLFNPQSKFFTWHANNSKKTKN